MQAYQETYVANCREIQELLAPMQDLPESFEDFVQARQERTGRVRQLREENSLLLKKHLVPALDGLMGAGEEELRDLTDFAGQLLDWKWNLDVGLALTIHGAMLRRCRLLKDRNGMIREMYQYGMSMYYHNRMVDKVECRLRESRHMLNEMLFTEAGTYFRYFEEIDDEETRGYIIRSLANIAIASRNRKRKIAASARVLKIVQDPYYRALATNLPWERFLRGTHQQMSANRTELSRANLTTQELALVLESCTEVFRPEEQAENPSVRWLWPYYDMAYSCGFVGIAKTMKRLEGLIRQTDPEGTDMSGLYGNVQLPLYYGTLMRKHRELCDDGRYVSFLDWAYRRMLHAIVNTPREGMDDYYFYMLANVISDYVELPGNLSYREVTEAILAHMEEGLYVSSLRFGEMTALLCRYMMKQSDGCMDEAAEALGLTEKTPEEKTEALCDFARLCGLYHDFGLVKMRMTRTMQARRLLEEEDAMYCMHTVSGSDDLRSRKSTADLADVCLGHHAYYAGSGGYPETYARNASPFRQITDAAHVVSDLMDAPEESLADLAARMMEQAGSRYSPMAVSCLMDQDLLRELQEIRDGDGTRFERQLFERKRRNLMY